MRILECSISHNLIISLPDNCNYSSPTWQSNLLPAVIILIYTITFSIGSYFNEESLKIEGYSFNGRFFQHPLVGVDRMDVWNHNMSGANAFAVLRPTIAFLFHFCIKSFFFLVNRAQSVSVCAGHSASWIHFFNSFEKPRIRAFLLLHKSRCNCQEKRCFFPSPYTYNKVILRSSFPEKLYTFSCDCAVTQKVRSR